MYAVYAVWLFPTPSKNSDSTHENKDHRKYSIKDWYMKCLVFTQRNILYLTLPV